MSGGPWADLEAARTSLTLEDFPNYKLLATVTLIQRNVTRVFLAPHRLGIPEWRVLALLGDVESLALRDLRMRTWMDKGQVSRVVTELVDRKLIARTADPDHRRRQIVAITPAGRQLYQSIMPVARDMLCELMGGLSVPQREGLYESLGVLEAASRTFRGANEEQD